MKYKLPEGDTLSELKDADRMVSDMLQYAVRDICVDEEGLTALVVK